MKHEVDISDHSETLKQQQEQIARLQADLLKYRSRWLAVRQGRLVVQHAMRINPTDVTPEILNMFRESTANDIANYLLENNLIDFEDPVFPGVYRCRFAFVPGRVLKAAQS